MKGFAHNCLGLRRLGWDPGDPGGIQSVLCDSGKILICADISLTCWEVIPCCKAGTPLDVRFSHCGLLKVCQFLDLILNVCGEQDFHQFYSLITRDPETKALHNVQRIYAVPLIH